MVWLFGTLSALTGIGAIIFLISFMVVWLYDDKDKEYRKRAGILSIILSFVTIACLVIAFNTGGDNKPKGKRCPTNQRCKCELPVTTEPIAKSEF